MIFDPAQIQRGARLRRSPYFEATQRAGCRGYTVYNHMLLPIRYASFEAEYRRLLADVTLWDVSVERNVEIAGRDGLKFAELLTPRDLSRCRVGEGRYVLLTDDAGGIVNDPVLLRLEENRFWLACADSDVLLWAKGVARNCGMDVELRELDVAPLQIQGPKSRDLVTGLFGDWVSNLKYYEFRKTELQGIPVIVTRTGWTGELGYELYLLDPARGVDLWKRVLKAGKRYRIAPTGPSDIRRIEAGILNYGIDMTLDNNPYELGLERLVNLDKQADFIGREALKRIARNGVTKKLVGLEISGTKMDLNFTRTPIRVEGKTAGFITSCVHSPRLKKNIGYAMLPLERSKEGTRLEIDAPDGVRAAVVVPMPFIDPKREIAKAS
jgi:aminomethyltransferase